MLKQIQTRVDSRHAEKITQTRIDSRHAEKITQTRIDSRHAEKVQSGSYIKIGKSNHG